MSTLIYVGTYTRGGSEGIYAYRLDGDTGKLTYVSKATGIVNPSFVALHPEGTHLYAVNEMSNFSGKSSGGVTAYRIDREAGELTRLNEQSSVGSGPCHVSVDATGRYVLVANYGSGSVAMLPIQSDGSLAEASDFVQHEGSSVDLRRQQEPHAHSINISPDNRFAFTPDLGLDKILIYRLDLEGGKLLPNDPPYAQIISGFGPRHFAFHPNGKYAYAITEMGNSVTVFHYDAERGALSGIQDITTLPEDFRETSYCADIHITPCGRYLYGSNRGHDSLAMFRIDQETGRLSPIGYESTQGKNPRNFMITRDGRMVLAANQDTSNVVSYWIDDDTGKLEPTGHIAEIPIPVCLVERTE